MYYNIKTIKEDFDYPPSELDKIINKNEFVGRVCRWCKKTLNIPECEKSWTCPCGCKNKSSEALFSVFKNPDLGPKKDDIENSKDRLRQIEKQREYEKQIEDEEVNDGSMYGGYNIFPRDLIRDSSE